MADRTRYRSAVMALAKQTERANRAETERDGLRGAVEAMREWAEGELEPPDDLSDFGLGLFRAAVEVSALLAAARIEAGDG